MIRYRVLVVLMFSLIGVAAFFSTPVIYYPTLAISAGDSLQMTFLLNPRAQKSLCEQMLDEFKAAISRECPNCRFSQANCKMQAETDHLSLLSGNTVGLPVSKIYNGFVTYSASTENAALNACRAAAARTSQFPGYGWTCDPPGKFLSEKPMQPVFASSSTNFFLVVLGALVSGFVGYLILRYEHAHRQWSHDHVGSGPQKIHHEATPRIGGIAVLSGLLVGGAALLALPENDMGNNIGILLLASLPAFGIGLLEDISKSVGVNIRLTMTMLAAGIGVWLLDAILFRTDLPIFDPLLSWTPFAIIFTIFAVGGVANAVNIIDGYNGIVAGYLIIALCALAWVASRVGDSFVIVAALMLASALAGFMYWNYPRGAIFLGDGGAYLAGFWTAELSVILVARHEEVSAWFPFLLLSYPIMETLFTIYRRRIWRNGSPSQADRSHFHHLVFHSVIAPSLMSKAGMISPSANCMVAPYLWAIGLISAVAAVSYWQNTLAVATITVSLLIVYVFSYIKMQNRIAGPISTPTD